MIRPILAFAAFFAFAARAENYDVVVYGGTCGGVTAAVQCSKQGKTVVVIEPGKHLGGLSAGGLGATDIGNKGAIGGLSHEFYERVGKAYGQPEAWKFEPHVAEKVFEDFIAENKILVVRGERLDLKNGVKKEGARIVSITMESGKVFAGKMFIDATYEGDLMAKAGVSYTVGREANAQYNETLNGVQVKNAKSHQFIKDVDPYIVKGDKKSGLIPGIQADGPGEEGAADKRVQAYNYRMCMTNVPENMIPWPKPADYDEKRFELVLRNIEASDLRISYNPTGMPNHKTDTNNNFAVSTDNIGMNYEYSDADYSLREKIIAEHKSYQMGFMWTLANHPRVNEKVRDVVSKWGLCKDEFTDNGGWPHQLYVREARRMVSDYVMTQHNCQGRANAEDAVGLAAYGMDSHNTQRYVTKEGYVRNEGDVQVHGFGPYPISYKSIVPKESECSNLLVPVCLSATHISYGSIRMEPVFMVLGQSSASAACQAIDENVSVQKINYAKLREKLTADKQILEWKKTAGAPATGEGGADPKKLGGIVFDDKQAELSGDWLTGISTPGFIGSGYLHDGNEKKGEKTAKFTIPIEAAGTYELRLAYSALGNRATNVPVTIAAGNDTKTVKVNERKAPPIEGRFVSLGKFKLEANSKAVVTISNKETDGHVIIDAIQLVEAK
jgi:hypothetical protein